jgi:HEAT repeat protein
MTFGEHTLEASGSAEICIEAVLNAPSDEHLLVVTNPRRHFVARGQTRCYPIEALQLPAAAVDVAVIDAPSDGGMKDAVAKPSTRPGTNSPTGAGPGMEPPPEKLAGAYARLLKGLTSDDPGERSAALREARSLPPTQGRTQIARTLFTLLAQPDTATRFAALQALEKWSTPSTTTALIGITRDESSPLRARAIATIGAIPDPSQNTIRAIAERLVDQRPAAGRALRMMGPATEPIVIEYLTHENPDVRGEACKILKEVGTAASLEPLSKLANDPLVRKEAAAAFYAIQSGGGRRR